MTGRATEKKIIKIMGGKGIYFEIISEVPLNSVGQGLEVQCKKPDKSRQLDSYKQYFNYQYIFLPLQRPQNDTNHSCL